MRVQHIIGLYELERFGMKPIKFCGIIETTLFIDDPDFGHISKGAKADL